MHLRPKPDSWQEQGQEKILQLLPLPDTHSRSFPATKLHAQLDEILELSSFRPDQTTFIAQKVKERMEEALSERTQQVAIKSRQLEEVNQKIEKNETRLMEEVIEPDTYKKWHKKFQVQRAILMEEINSLTKNRNEKWDKLYQTLPYLTSIKSIYRKATVIQKHSILRVVFKHGLTYHEGAFRTPSINPTLAHNAVKLKEKGLLYIEQSSNDLGENPLCSEIGS